MSASLVGSEMCIRDRVVVVSALLNGLLVNSILSLINSTSIDVITVFRFVLGDLLGSFCVTLGLWIIFKTLTDNRLIINPED